MCRVPLLLIRSGLASRRAVVPRRKVRLYCAEHGLNRLGTLTYAGEGCHNPQQLRRDVAEFFRALACARWAGRRSRTCGFRSGTRPTTGCMCTSRWAASFRAGSIDAAWGRGFVHIKRLGQSPGRVGSPRGGQAAAGYLSKYVTKSFEQDESVAGAGAAPVRGRAGVPARRCVRLRGCSAGSVIAQAAADHGCASRPSCGPRWKPRSGRVRRLSGCVGLSHLSLHRGEIAAWVASSCLAQGVPVKVTDPAMIRQVGVLLGAAPGGAGAQARSAAPALSGVGSERQTTDTRAGSRVRDSGSAGSDHGVVHQARDDGVLSRQVQAFPRSA